MAEKPRTPSIAISLLPVVTLVIMLAVAIYIFRGDSLGGASQIVLLIATSICSLIAVFHCKIDSRFLRSLERLVPYHALAYDRTDRYRNHDRQEDTFDRSAFRLFHTRRNIRLDLPAKRLIGDFRDHG